MQYALANLILEKDLHRITVQELADKADIHRATFYSHYHDVYDLYEQIENEVLSKLAEVIASDATHKIEDIFKSFIDYIHNNAALFSMFLGEKRIQSSKTKFI